MSLFCPKNILQVSSTALTLVGAFPSVNLPNSCHLRLKPSHRKSTHFSSPFVYVAVFKNFSFKCLSLELKSYDGADRYQNEADLILNIFLSRLSLE